MKKIILISLFFGSIWSYIHTATIRVFNMTDGKIDLIVNGKEYFDIAPGNRLLGATWVNVGACGIDKILWIEKYKNSGQLNPIVGWWKSQDLKIPAIYSPAPGLTPAKLYIYSDGKYFGPKNKGKYTNEADRSQATQLNPWPRKYKTQDIQIQTPVQQQGAASAYPDIVSPGYRPTQTPVMPIGALGK